LAILVTGAGGTIGRAAVRALLRQGVEHVRAVVRDEADVPALRRAGARVAVLDAADADNLELVAGGVHTAVGLAGSLWTGGDPAQAVLGPWRALVAAAGRAGIRRLILLVPPGADPASANPYLAACGRAEELVAGSGTGSVVLRVTHVLATGAQLVERLRRGQVPGDGSQRVAPVLAGDVAAAVAAADAAAEPPARLGLQGPDVFTMAELATMAGEAGPGRPPAPLTAAQADLLARDSLLDPAEPDGWAEFGLTPRPVGLDLAVAPSARPG
jgi:uncharacterized protein YbjT (DUF2867 family)